MYQAGRSRRNQGRIDYKVFHETGVKIYKEAEPLYSGGGRSETGDSSMDDKEMAENNENLLRIQADALSDDIDDFLDENAVEDISQSMKDLEMAINKAEELRSIYRGRNKELQALMKERYDEALGRTYEKKLVSMKQYILEAKRCRTSVTDMEKKSKDDERDLRRQSFTFLITEQKRVMTQLEYDLGKSFEEIDDKELKRRKEELPQVLKTIDDVSKRIPEIIKYSSPGEDDEAVEDIKKIHSVISMLQRTYVSQLKKLIDEREIVKEDKFNEASLNIKLLKFKGYGSATDIFTFKSEFEKLHLRTTPKRLLPDLLKNNFLDDSALSLVKSVDDIDVIWERLKKAFGDAKVMMNKKLAEINNAASLLRSREAEKISSGLSQVINLLRDLISLAEKHRIEEKLYHGDGLDRVFKILGEGRVTRWLSESAVDDLDGKRSWESIINFLEKELKVQQQKMLIYGKGDTDHTGKKHYTHLANSEGVNKEMNQSSYGDKDAVKDRYQMCSICGEAGHVSTVGPNYKKVIQYFTCKRFVEMSPEERFKVLRAKQLCFQCLLPGASSNEEKHRKGRCQRDFTCKHPSHQKYPRKKHVLVCEEHKDSKENKDLLEEYKARCILKEKIASLPSFSKEIKLSFYAEEKAGVTKSDACAYPTATEEKAIYQLQIIKVADKRYSIFFDSGCGDFVSRHKAVLQLGDRAIQERAGPIQLGGVGGISTVSPHGIYNVNLPLCNGEEALLSGVCLEEITEAFPKYPLKGKVEDDIRQAYVDAGGDVKSLPRLPSYVGGEMDFLIGIKYLRYHPEKLFQLPSGLTIYESVFENADGGRGVIGGPYEVFTAIDCHFHFDQSHESTFLCNQLELFRTGYQVNPDLSLLGYIDSWSGVQDVLTQELKVGDVFLTRKEKIFNAAENAGSEITYRCVKCRSCKTCKGCDHTEAISIREEVEEELIRKSVEVDVGNRIAVASLPLIHDPTVKLAPNKYKAMKVFNQQIKKLHASPHDKAEVLKSEGKLQSLGYVDYVRNLTEEQQLMLRNSLVQNFIPWRVVWKDTSVTTPCRVVFDASQDTGSGYSLNDVLAKGRNNMNKLQEMFIRWLTHKVGFHTDVQKMYNCVSLKESNWCFQRYLWQEELDVQKIPEEKVIKTLIYGVKCSGNLAERSIRETAALSKDDYPEVHQIVCKDIYVDDCLSGEISENAAASRADQLEIVLNKGGFSLKGVAFSGKDPPDSLSDDGVSIVVGGLRWYTRDDQISLNMGKLNFSKKRRGRKDGEDSKIPEKLTRRHCASKVAEVFDILGKITPITMEMKLDLHNLVQRKLDWDDAIPDNLRTLWESHFVLMQEINSLKYNRAIIPSDAVDLLLETLDFGDASQSAACVAIYVRFRRTNGEHSCQLILSRSRLVPDGMTQPRAELYAAVLNTHSGEVVKRALGKYHQCAQKFTDSQIALHWISNEERPLKQWVRNRVIEVRRFTEVNDWSYVKSENMIADMGTRRGAKLSDVNQESPWINGFDWMKKDRNSFPVQTVHQLSLSKEEMQTMKKEVPFNHGFEQITDIKAVYNCAIVLKQVPSKVEERYKYSRYVMDPNRHSFKSVIRIIAYVYRFVNILIRRIREKDVNRISVVADAVCLVDHEDVKNAENYFYRKATLEVKHFLKEKQYEKISREKDGVLLYTGRILPTDQVDIVTSMTSAMYDLATTTFCVPVVDRFSPIAYAIVNDVHWNDETVMHSGIETMWRFVLKSAFIIEGRELVKMIKKSCERCRYLEKRTIEVAMGPVSKYNMTIAPSFYITQVDLAGPFKSYSGHNKRATLKIWLVVYCCATTSTTSIKVMEDYSSTSFIQSFVRLSCDVGYPKMLLADGGSQLVKSLDSIRLNFRDIKFRLHRDKSVEFDVCPVGGHNMHGKVERKIREIRSSLDKIMINERLSILQWETVGSEIANSINDLPLALGNLTSDFESMDLLTPNRLRLGRNNNRSPVGSLTVSNNPSKILESNMRIFKSWFDNWLISHVPKLIPQPKWFKSDMHLKEGDIVLFRKHESVISSCYQYGMVKSVQHSRDGVIRKARIRYRNSNENVDRETYRSIRELIMIHRLDELNIVQELGQIANQAEYKLKLEMQHNAQ